MRYKRERYRKGPRGKILLPVLVLAVALALAGAFYLQNQERQDVTWAASLEAGLLNSEAGPLFSLLKQGFPEEYDAFLQDTALSLSGLSPAEGRSVGYRKGQEFTTALRQQNAHYLATAPLENLRAVRRLTLELMIAFEDNPETCIRFAVHGGAGLLAEEISPAVTAGLTRASVATFEAILAGRDHPVSHPQEQAGDRVAFLAAWVEGSAPSEAMQQALKSGDGELAELCAALISVERFVAEGRSPLVERMLVALSRETVAR